MVKYKSRYRHVLNRFIYDSLKKDYPDLCKVSHEGIALPIVLTAVPQDFDRLVRISVNENYFKPFNPLLPRTFSLQQIK